MQKQPPVMVDYTVFFDEWRDADGVKFPFKMRRAMGSETTEGMDRLEGQGQSEGRSEALRGRG